MPASGAQERHLPHISLTLLGSSDLHPEPCPALDVLERDPTSRQSGFSHYRHDPSDPGSLPGDQVTALYHDRGGALWVGTQGRGLGRLEPGRGAFRNFRHRPEQPGSLADDNVSAITEDRGGTLWVATFRGGLDRFQLDSTRFPAIRQLHLSAVNEEGYPEELQWLVEGIDVGDAAGTRIKDLRRIPRTLDASRLAAPAGVHLGLDHPLLATQALGRFPGRARGLCRGTLRHRHPVVGEEAFRLILVQIHV